MSAWLGNDADWLDPLKRYQLKSRQVWRREKNKLTKLDIRANLVYTSSRLFFTQWKAAKSEKSVDMCSERLCGQYYGRRQTGMNVTAQEQRNKWYVNSS